MDRRDSLKAIALGSISSGLILASCKDEKDPNAKVPDNVSTTAKLDRMPEEQAHYDQVSGMTYFTKAEMATITILADIIIPKDDVSGSASDAGVPDFIEFIVKDMPHHQVPMRGGLRWLDLHCLRKYEKSFKDCTTEQQMETVNAIAYPNKATPDMKPGVNFFNLMRNLTATGFYTSEMGVKDLGYAGNKPNQWNGVPDEVLKQYNLSYSERELNESVKFE